MNLWLDAGNGMMIVMAIALVSILRDSAVRRIIALSIFTLFGSVALTLYAIAFERPGFADLGIALGILSFGGTLAFAHVYERWL